MDNFIYVQDKALDDSICDRLIEYFEKSTHLHTSGFFSNSEGLKTVNPHIKDSTDISFNLNSMTDFTWYTLIEKACFTLTKEITEYKKHYFELDDNVNTWKIYPIINMQRYLPGQGYKSLHCECAGKDWTDIKRILAWMIYLNDVDDGGTEFLRFGKIEAKKGRYVIWPAYWTHVHKGEISNTKTKYILTGWYNFILE